MALPSEYAPLEEPRHIRLLQVWLDEHDRQTLEEYHSRLLDQVQKEAADNDNERSSLAAIRQATQGTGTRLEAPLRIKGRFVKANLDNLRFSYRAISYVWGNPTMTHKVWIDEIHYLEVTASAMEVLTHMVVSNTNDYLWIDALCINQRDDEEKSHQIQLMYDVYSRAEVVLAWAGQPSNDGQLALGFVSTLSHEIRRSEDTRIPLTKANISGVSGCQWPSPKWTALAQFVKRPFFQRVWIIQEMVAAKQIRLTCGIHSLDRMVLAETVAKIRLTGGSLFLDHDLRIDSRKEAAGISAVVSLRAHVKLQKKFHPLPYVLAICQTFATTDPRDRVFAIFNISDANTITVRPDYKKPVEVVFTNVAKHMLTENCPMISLLYSAGIGYDRKLGLLPSWVPDWTTEIPSMSFGLAPDGAGHRGYESYNASGRHNQLTGMPIYIDDALISLKGKIIDDVKSHHDERPEMQVPTADWQLNNNSRLLQWLIRLCHIFPDNYIYPTGVPFCPNVISHILVAGADDRQLSRYPIDPHFADFFAMLILSVLDGAAEEKLDPIPKLVTEEALTIQFSRLALPDEAERTSTVRDETLKEAYRAFELYDLRVRKKRKIFTTRKGYAGLGPLLMQEDDMVCLIHGASVPFLIRRRSEGNYLLVGECYLHGLMHGEGLSMGVEQDIVLC